MTEGTPHQALYRRWRAQTFSEIVGQEAVVATLRNAVATGKVAHAILFAGPRGTGKTSLARILAKALNCLDLQANADPCDRCASCVAIREGTTLDVLELDAATNRGIDDIRDLRDRLAYPPGELRRKVYILDEAHQITRDAWNALLKSLEEPPDFVAFMFASTHPHGFPPAVMSRLQRFDVRRLSVDEISGKLERILAADGRDADPEAIGLIARLAAGGMRDAESILDQLLASTADRIEAAAVRDLLGLADADLVDGFVDALAAGDSATAVALLARLDERGRDARAFLDQVTDVVRERVIGALAGGERADPELVAAAHRLAAIDPTRLGPGGLRLQLELVALDAAARRPAVGVMATAASSAPASASQVPPAAALAAPPSQRAAQPSRAKPASAPVEPIRAEAALPAPEPAAQPSPAALEPTAAGSENPPATPSDPNPATRDPDIAPEIPSGAEPTGDLEHLRAGWPSITQSASPALKALIVECRPVTVEGNVITLGFPEEKPFMRSHAERNRARLEAHFAGFLGHPVSIRCVVSNLDLLPPLPSDDDAAHILAEAQRIFADDLADVPEVT